MVVLVFPENGNLGFVQEQDTVSIHMGGGLVHPGRPNFQGPSIF